MQFVYILRSISNPEYRHFGITSDLGQRLSYHNQGQSKHTSKFIPGHRPLGSNAEWKDWTWKQPIRTSLRGEASYGEREGQQPLGQSAERKWWTRYTQIRTTPRGEASHGEREGQQPLGSSAEREKWRWGESNPRPRSREKSSLHV